MTALLKVSFIHLNYEDISRLEVVLGFVYHPLENLVNVQFSFYSIEYF